MNTSRDYYESLKKQITKIQPFINNTELAYEVILHQILEGSLQPGDKIPQETLATYLNMSRTPVRDALMRLEEDQFIEKTEKNSYQVCRLHLRDYVNFCEFRITLEVKAAYLAARNIREDEMEQLTQNIEALQTAIKNKNHAQILQLDMEFHSIICKASRNEYIYQTMQKYRKKEIFNMQMILKEHNFRLLENKHLDIYKAICESNETKAAEAMQSHLQFYINRILNLFFD